MTHLEIREKFLEFFSKKCEKEHKIAPSYSLIPDDQSVLFTTAGMQQFQPYYTGQKDPLKDAHPNLGAPIGSKNVVSIQKCLRTSDINEVGDESHLTFFEMLGNFSFGGYFKKEAIQYAHEFITKELGLKIDYVSVFEGDKKIPADKESEKIWKEIDGNLKIKQAGKEDNFWGPTGNEGPCGPTTEIYINGTEIWNIVFNEYYCGPCQQSANSKQQTTFEKLKTPGVDTGMGLERLAMIMQKKNNVFETDLFASIVASLKSQISNFKTAIQNSKINKERSIWIIADHIKASAFLIAEGIEPSNVGRGYILRRLLRKSMTRARLLLAIKQYTTVLDCALNKIIEIYKDKNLYPALEIQKNKIQTTIAKEEDTFYAALEKGLKEFEKIKNIDAKAIFNLYQTYSLPLEIGLELTRDKGIIINEEEIAKEFKKHQEISRAGAEKKFGGHGFKKDREVPEKIKRLHTATHLLHQVLRDIFGKNVKQMGSDINEERLRFDFSFSRKMTPEEIKKAEDLVNQKIQEGLKVTMEEMSYEDAINTGALAFFKEKYPKQVKVYSIGNFSREICGGFHAKNTAELGRFKILKEESSSAGVRRIKAILE